MQETRRHCLLWYESGLLPWDRSIQQCKYSTEKYLKANREYFTYQNSFSEAQKKAPNISTILYFSVQSPGEKCTVFSILCRSVSKCMCVCMCTNKHISVFDVPATAGTFRGSWKRSFLKHPRSCSVSALNNPFCLQLWQAAGTPLWGLSSLYLQLTAYYFFS